MKMNKYNEPLGIEDLYILNELFSYRGSKKSRPEIVNNKFYFYIDFMDLFISAPILNLSDDILDNKIQKYIKMGLLERKTVHGCLISLADFGYFHITEKLENLRNI